MNQDGLPALERLNPRHVRHLLFVEMFLVMTWHRFRKHSPDGNQNSGRFTFR